MTLSLAFALVAFIAIALLAATFVVIKRNLSMQSQLVRYSAIQSIEAEVARLQTSVDQQKRDASIAQDKAVERRKQLDGEFEAANYQEQARRKSLDYDYQLALAEYNRLKQEVSIYEEKLNDISFGVYEPHFSFETSEEYKNALSQKRDSISSLIKNNQAATCTTGWLVNGNAREGQKMVKQTMKVILRAFNSECEAALANVSYTNIVKMEERVRKSCDAVSKLGESMHIVITPKFLALRLDELRLANEHETKKYKEREEQRAAREQMREDQKAVQEIEKAQREAEADESTYLRLLEKARKEASEASGSQLRRLVEQVAGFEAKLDEARKNKERAISRAQQTRSGFVYVISNVGAFGPGVFKIGLTRRLEPLDRIAELSGASVPFPYDLHAMMFSMDAPALECKLHNLFESRKLNLVNGRKEFFQHVHLSEIEDFVREQGHSAQFIEHPEAREWKETLAKRQKEQDIQPIASPYLPSLFPVSEAISEHINETMDGTSTEPDFPMVTT